jgi:Bacterial alpha-L-rhamnosidase C-terminal domain
MVEGGFETGLGWFGVKWQLKDGEMTIHVNTPKGTRGVVVFPDEYTVNVNRDGREVDKAELKSVSGGPHVFVGRSSHAI